MKIFFAGLNPCNTRKVNVRQYLDFITTNSHTLVKKPEDADLVLVWGCAFRSDWRSFTFSIIKELKQKCRGQIIYIGCVTNPGELTEATNIGVTIIPWNDKSGKFEALVAEEGHKLNETSMDYGEKQLVGNVAEYRLEYPLSNVSFEDEYVKLHICEGCLGNCTFCSEKLMFPPFRSFPEDKIIESCQKALYESNTRKVLFLADSSGYYGIDTGSSLSKLIQRLQKTIDPSITIAISQLNPEHLIHTFCDLSDLIANQTIDYLNLPIQSASNSMLKAMNRRYDRQQLEKLFGWFQQIGFTDYSTHLLIGFPGETMDDLRASIEFVLKYKPRHIVLSIFMSHTGIPASQLPNQINAEESRKRLEFCEKTLSDAGIRVASDYSHITERLMERIRHSIRLGK